MGLHAYLRRQDRNEFINLASQIAFDGINLAFVFYENQIRRLMNESPYDERRLEVPRASCVGQLREMVTLFSAPMRSLTTSQRIEKALDRLRQRYGVSGGLSLEPKVMAIRNAPKIINDLPSLKMFIEDLNTLEVFAFAHDEAEKLSGKLLFDIASRLPNVLKRRYLDFLDQKGLNLSRPGFESLREFIAHEIKMMTSDCAQAFFGRDGKDGQSTSRSKNYRVRQVTVNSEVNAQDARAFSNIAHTRNSKTGDKTLNKRPLTQRGIKDIPALTCFVCLPADLKHFLGDCEKFKTYKLTPRTRSKRQIVIDAKRCLNCLSLEHFVRECPYPSKCRKCGPSSQNIHTGALHESCQAVGHGAAKGEVVKPPSNANDDINVEGRDLNALKINSVENGVVLMRTSAVKIVNPTTGKSSLVYAQHDTASQATLISETLKAKLGLRASPDPTVSLRTLANEKVSSGGRTNFKLESL